ncbi:MAG: hypothetical protein WD894_20945 [Pirellulales bacterium]
MAKPSSPIRYTAIAGLAIFIAAYAVVALLRVEEVIAAFESKAFDESVEQLLVENDVYFYRYTSKKLGQDDLPLILSSRRCVEVIEEIGGMREADRDKKCSEVFSRLFARHTAAVRRSLQYLEDRKSPKNEQSMLSSELAVGTAILATALHGGTKTLLAQFSALNEFREEIDRRLAANAHVYPRNLPVAVNTRQYYGLDNRFQLNALCLHAARIGGAPAETAKEICSRLEKNELPIANRQPNRSWFDIPRRVHGIPTERSGGEISYVLYDWSSEMVLDDIRECRFIEELRRSLVAYAAVPAAAKRPEPRTPNPEP